MRSAKAQVANEYIYIIAVSVAILVGLLGTTAYYVESSSCSVVENSVQTFGYSVLGQASEVYAFAPPSQTHIKSNAPSQITSMQVASDTNDEGKVYYLKIHYQCHGDKTTEIKSDVPIGGEITDTMGKSNLVVTSSEVPTNPNMGSPCESTVSNLNPGEIYVCIQSTNAPATTSTPIVQVCGNDAIEGTEACDDGNTADCNPIPGCNRNCTRADGICGDGYVDCAETCDNGKQCENLITDCTNDPSICIPIGTGTCALRNGDGCSTTCQTEGMPIP
jgi:hypothetical protein